MTPQDLQQISNIIREENKNFASKDDVENIVASSKESIIKRIDDLEESQLAIFQSADKNKAEKLEHIALDKRVRKLEKRVFAS